MHELHEPLLRWYDAHARDLPWRRTSASAWSVLVSEFMLQQTPVVRLHAAATQIRDRHGGRVPDSYDDLRALPGVGDYTASAVLAFAFGRRRAVLDTNVRRVLARAVVGTEFPPNAVTATERRLGEDLLHRSLLDDLTGVHQRHAVGHAGYHCQVVRDQQHGELAISSQLVQQLENLRLNCNVERGCRFVSD